ncbi:hypothetical protein IKR55_04835, partial [bacterium]|nr:hypothetical protein [bacterium]
MLKRLHKKNYINTLAIASIAGLAFCNASVCAENLNPADYVENTYGTGDSAKYYKYEINSQGN